MKNLTSHTWIQVAFLLFLISFILPITARSQDINLDSCGPLHTFNLNVGTPFNESINVLNSNGTVFWEFNSTPPGATSTDGFLTDFTIDGVTVTLPAGTPAAVAETATTTVDGTASTGGSHFFTLTVTDETDPALTCNQDYELRVNRPLDVVLVLDRSGSMGTTTGAGGTRWDALDATASNFGNMYQVLDRPDDRLSITYFDTDLNPLSACCSTFVPHGSTLGTTIHNDIIANSPGGLTAMGQGMQNAQTKLSDPDRALAIILFTDGRQNQDPEVRTDGTGYENPVSEIPSDIKIATIGIDGPNGDYHTTLLNLADQNGGSYNTTDDGSAFNFEGGDPAGDLSAGFTEAFITMLSEFSPQLIDRTSTEISDSAGFETLQTFPLNRYVDKLLLELAVDRNFETPGLAQLLGSLQILKNDTLVTQYANPSWVGNFTNTVLLTFDFGEPPPAGISGTPLEPEGEWTVRLVNTPNLRINHANLASIADDHVLDIEKQFENATPRVNESFPISVSVKWMGAPVEDATVEALFLRPGEDLGDLLARNPLTVDASGSTDAGLPGTQKFEELWQNDPAFREQLKKTENILPLHHTTDGAYEGVFEGLDVAGVYRIVLNVRGDLPDAGSFSRTLSESIYTTFGGEVDLAESGVTADVINDQQLVMNFRPITDYGRFIGPAMGDAFRISDPDVQISEVEDHQDGSYTITFTGDIDSRVTLELLGQDIYTGRLENVGRSGSIIDTIREWLELIGLPGWTIWLLLLLILLMLWLIFRKAI